MGEVLLLVVVFVAGAAVGAALTWWILSRSRPVVRAAPDSPATAGESEVSQLASASRQLMAELETRYQGRKAEDDQPKRRTRRPRR